LEVTPEGLRIQLVDQEKSSMFPLGSSVMQDNARRLMDQVARIVKDLPNKITISGHTDSLPYRGGSGGYSNWELSADRANASRRALVASGVPDNRIALVVGKADTDPLIAENPAAAQNRRISIVVLRNDPKASVGRQSGAPAAGPPTQLANRPNDASQAPQGPGRPAPAAAAPVRRQ
jgi:chemotaxis protein MotB